MRVSRQMSAGAVTALTAAALVGPAGPAAAAPVNVLQYRFDGLTVGSPFTAAKVVNSGTVPLSSGGSAGLTVAVDHRAAAAPNTDYEALGAWGATTSSSTHPQGTAMDLPPYQVLTSTPALAGIRITETGYTTATDPLSPGTGAFTWRADFSLDTGTTSAGSDGDNIFQRGLQTPGSGGQWKLSADGGDVRCTIYNGGTVNSTNVHDTPADVITPVTGDWYRATCSRSAAGVLSLNLQKWDPAAGAYVAYNTRTWSGTETTNLQIATTVPVSIGVKMLQNGTGINTAAPDQFNGLIDNASLTIG